MRVLFTIPHYCQVETKSEVTEDTPRYASVTSPKDHRAEVLRQCLRRITGHFAGRALELDHRTGLVGSAVLKHAGRCRADVVICTTPQNHVLDEIVVPACVQHCPSDCDPQYLGFECHQQMRDRAEQYDYYCYLEDDIYIDDPLLFSKQRWFHQQFGDECMLQPHRYEWDEKQRKVYVDGPLPESFVRRFFDPDEQHLLSAECLAESCRFERTVNPMSGCFFLSRVQLQRWIESPGFGDRDVSFASPLESAQILGPLQRYRVYKPVMEQADWMEVEHGDPRLTRLRTPRELLRKWRDE